MDAQEYWKAFLDSGIPEYYLLYNKARRAEQTHVSDNPGTCAEGITLQ